MNRVRALPPRPVAAPRVETDADVVRSYLEDAAHYPGGHAAGVSRPTTVDEVAALVQSAARVLAIGAQSSLTGGATPHGDLVLSTERLQRIDIGRDTVTTGAGVALETLQQRLAEHGVWFPPVPTYLGAKVGGAVATNAAGAATFKYGPIRRWVDAVTVVLASGDILSIHRGEVTADGDGFLIEDARGVTPIPVPRLTMPAVPKCSAGYYAAPGMDLVDLFIGSEGTLGVIAEATLRVTSKPAAIARALIPVASERGAIALVRDLRLAAERTWRDRDPRGLDIAAIEHIDRRALEVVIADGVDRRLNIAVDPATDVILLVEIELHGAAATSDIWARLDEMSDAAPDAVGALFALLHQHGVFDDTEIVLPHDRARAAALLAFREAVPAGVNRRVGMARDRIDARIHKTAADMIVPFDRFGDMMRLCRRLFEQRGLDLAVWGHISDGNVHPNVIPRSYADVEQAREAIRELGRAVVDMGGSPLAEHGVGRSPLKQELLRLLYGDAGIDEMRHVKRALDPQSKLAPGVLF